MLKTENIKQFNAVTIKGINNEAALALAPLVMASRRAKIKNKELALLFVEAGAKSSAAVSISSDLRALGEYLDTYPAHKEVLEKAAQGKEWRDYLCAARRGHRLSNGGLDGEARAKVLGTAGAKAHKVSTANAFLADNQEAVTAAKEEIATFFHGKNKLEVAAPAEAAVVEAAPKAAAKKGGKKGK